MAEIVLWKDAGDELLDQFESAFSVTQTPIPELPVRPESKALHDVVKVASRIVVHESCDCWFDAYVKLLIAGKLYRLLVEFKPCFAITRLDWLRGVVSGLLEVRIHSKDQARVLGPDFHDVPRAERSDAASILVSTDASLLLVNRATLAASFGASQALAGNVLRNFDPCNPYPGVVWLTTPEPFNYLVVDKGGAEVLLLVFEAAGRFVEARAYEPTRSNNGSIFSLGGVRRRIQTLKEAATAFGAEHEVELGRWATHAVLSEDVGSVVCIGTIDNTLDAAIERKFRRFEPPAKSPYLAPNSWWADALSPAVRDAWAAATPTSAQKKILAAQLKVLDTINGSAPGMAGADARATKVAASSLKATYEYYAAHPFDASDVRGSGHDALHPVTYAWAHDCSQAAGKVKLAEAGGTLVYVTPDGDEIRARDDAWQAGQRPMVKLIAYEKDDSGSVEAQVLKRADALAIVEAMADDEAKEETKEESEEEESDAPAAQRARTE